MSNPFFSSSPLFISLLSGFIMIAWNGFSCKWGPFVIIPDKKGVKVGLTLGIGMPVLELATDAG